MYSFLSCLQITLKAQDDIRVFRIECTVVPEGSQAELEFNTPVHEPLTQDIPIVRHTQFSPHVVTRLALLYT